MVDYRKIILYAAYIAALINVLRLLLHLTALGLQISDAKPLKDVDMGILSDYIKNLKLPEIIAWIVVDLINSFTTYMLISAVRQENCDAALFMANCNTTAAVAFASLVLWRLKNGENSLNDIGPPAISLVTSLPLAALVYLAVDYE